MSETIESKSLSKNDVVKAFGDRVLWQPEKVEKEYLELDEGLLQRDLVEHDVADKYERAQITDPDTFDPHPNLSEDFLKNFDYYRRAEKPISAQLIKSGSAPVTLMTAKYMEDLKHKEKGKKQNIFYSLFAYKGDLTDMDIDKIKEARKNKEKTLAHFQMIVKDDNTFLINHRFVYPNYRGPQNNSNETLGNIGLKACEQTVQSYVNKEGQPKTIELDVAQLDVIMWLHTNGYTPKTDKDKKRFERVVNADQNLVIVDDNYIWEKDKWTPGTDVVKNRHEGLEIIFEKTIEPTTESADQVAQGTRDKIAGLV